jgi:cytochrome b
MNSHNYANPAGSTTLPAAPAAPASPPAMVEVWDIRVRAFHWGLAGLFLVAYLSGEESESLHLLVGYCIAGLLVLRIVWGFNGPPHARFSDFVRSPRDVLNYIKLVRKHRAPRYLGHNPAGGAMSIALMTMIGGICLTGHLMTTSAWWGSATMENLHVMLVNGTLGLITLHLLGSLFSSRLHNENLTMSMINGLKRPQ